MCLFKVSIKLEIKINLSGYISLFLFLYFFFSKLKEMSGIFMWVILECFEIEDYHKFNKFYFKATVHKKINLI